MKISNPLKYFIILMVIFLPYFFGINLVQDNKASVISLILFVGIVCFASLNNNFSKKNFDLGFNYFYINFLNIVLLFVFIIVTQNYYLNYETITWDVASYLVASQEINQGYLPFETQWESKGPLFMYLFNAVSIIAGKNYLYFRLYNDVLIFLITCLMYFKILIHTDSNRLKALVGSLFFSSLVNGYQSERKLTEHEKNKLNISLRGAAIRFLLTRLLDFYKEEKNFLKKDPLDFLNILSFHTRNDLKC